MKPAHFVRFALASAALPLLLFFGPPALAASWITNSPMITGHAAHTATLLPDGTVLVAGGRSSIISITTGAELFNPAIGTWTATAPMATSRIYHSAVLLTNGLVLVAGGTTDEDIAHIVSSTELYSPGDKVWLTNAPLNTTRAYFTATLLPNGKVLVAGGTCAGGAVTNTAELYDPVTRTWTMTGAMEHARYAHTATLLPDGNVLVTGGSASSSGFQGMTSAEIYNSTSGSWTDTGSMTNARVLHVAILLANGKVLVAGGGANTSAELFDPVTQTWITTGPVTTHSSATLLPNGTVLVAGASADTSAYLYDPTTGIWTATASLQTMRAYQTATLLANGKVLVAGGLTGGTPFASTEIYDPTINPATGTWTNSGIMAVGRYGQVAKLLPNGRVLLIGGETFNSANTTNVELYDPATGQSTTTGPLNNARLNLTTTLLPNGRVLVTGGADFGSYPIKFLSSTEVYDPGTEVWTSVASMHSTRQVHTATLLPNGKVLIAGGDGSNGIVASAELYDPAADRWTLTGAMSTPRAGATATLLPNGKILVAGGNPDLSGSYTNGAELYDPATGIWSPTGSMAVARAFHDAILLPNGQVIVVGGFTSNNTPLSTVELYHSDNGTWTATGSLNTVHEYPARSVLLPSGKVLIAGGLSNFNTLASAEQYDPATQVWTFTGALNTARHSATATVLPNGKVLIAGGTDVEAFTLATTNELYDAGLAFSNSWRPEIDTITSPLALNGSLKLTGSQFQGISEGSSGASQNSPGNCPVVQLCSLENNQFLFLLATNWSANAYSSAPVNHFPPGFALATMFVNGIPGVSSIINLSTPSPTSISITNLKQLADGSFQFTFTNSPGAVFGVQATTNLSLPLSEWTLMSGVTEISPGRFQFTDSQASNRQQRFYRLSSP